MLLGMTSSPNKVGMTFVPDDEDDDVDSLRTRLADADTALRMHVELAAELSAELSTYQEAVARCVRCEAAEAAAQAAEETATTSRDAVTRSAIRLLDRRTSQALCRQVLAAWRSHCEK
eukprot:6998488-Prymnesium_polylepis.1